MSTVGLFSMKGGGGDAELKIGRKIVLSQMYDSFPYQAIAVI